MTQRALTRISPIMPMTRLSSIGNDGSWANNCFLKYVVISYSFTTILIIFYFPFCAFKLKYVNVLYSSKNLHLMLMKIIITYIVKANLRDLDASFDRN